MGTGGKDVVVVVIVCEVTAVVDVVVEVQGPQEILSQNNC